MYNVLLLHENSEIGDLTSFNFYYTLTWEEKEKASQGAIKQQKVAVNGLSEKEEV